MQTPRERMLALLLLGAIFFVGGGFICYQFLYAPIRDRNNTIRTLQTDIDTRHEKLLQIETDRPRLEVHKKRSLPADIDMSRREYEIKLNQLLRDSDFLATSIVIDPRPADITSSPTLLNKKPIYTKLTFVVHVRGELLHLLDFMAGFYKMDLLHQIKKINVQALATSRAGQKPTDLEIDFTIEALVLDVAEKRPTLLASNSTGPAMRVLAEPDRDYGSIAGRDLFNGPTPPPPPERVARTEEAPLVDLTPFIRLTSITLDNVRPQEQLDAMMMIGGGLGVKVPPMSHAKAELFDFYNHYDFVLEQSANGGSQVEAFYHIGDRKKRLNAGKILVIGEEDAKNKLQYRVVRIIGSEMIVQKVEPRVGARGPAGIVMGPAAAVSFVDPFYRWRVGDLLKDIKKITGEEAVELGKLVKAMERNEARRPPMFGPR